MNFLSSLDIPVSNEAAGVILLALIAFWRELFGLIKLPFTSRERTADAMVQEATAFEKLMSQNLEMQQQNIETQRQLIATTSTFTQFVMDTRKRTDEREAKHNEQVKALEKSLIDSQVQIGDLTEHITNLQNIQDKFKADYTLQERLVEEQGRSIKKLEESEKQAHRLVIAKDEKILELEGRVKELEAEIARLKAQQQPAIPALVAAIGATNEPLTAADTRELSDIMATLKSDAPESKPADTGAVPGESVPSMPESGEVAK